MCCAALHKLQWLMPEDFKYQLSRRIPDDPFRTQMIKAKKNRRIFFKNLYFKRFVTFC